MQPKQAFRWPLASAALSMFLGVASNAYGESPDFQQIWDMRYPNRVAVHEMTMTDGAMLPDGSMAILAMGDEWRGSLGLYRLGRNGDFRGRQEFRGWHWWHIEQPNPAIVPIASESSGFIVVGSHLGYARIPLDAPVIPDLAWNAAPLAMATAISASSDGSVWIGGTEENRLESLSECSRAVIAKFDGADRRRWVWTSEFRARSAFVRQIEPLADGAILAYVSTSSPVGYGGGAIAFECDGEREEGWLVRVTADGRTSWIADLGSDMVKSFALGPDGGIAVIGFSETQSNSWSLRLRKLSADGEHWILDRRYEFGRRRHPHPDAVPAQLPMLATLYRIEKFGALSNGYYIALSFDCPSCRRWSTHLVLLDGKGVIVAISPAWPAESRFLLGIDQANGSFTVGGSNGVFRLSLP